MANHTVLIPNKAAFKNIDSYTRPALSQQDMDNGYVFNLTGKEVTSGCEVWTVTVPATGSLSGLWMAYEPELPFVLSGTRKYNGLGTIQDFYVSASLVFTAVKPQVGDIITVTAEAFTSGTAPTTTNCYANAVNGAFTLTAAAVSGAGQSWKFLGYTYIPSADGSIGSGRITAYQLECIIV